MYHRTNASRTPKRAHKRNNNVFFSVSRHGIGGKVVLLRVNEAEPRSQQPGYDFVLKQAFERNHIQQRFIDDAGVEIPCLDSMHIRKNLESNETLQNRNGYPQRCYVFLDDMFMPSSLQQHLDQLKSIVDICQNICLNNDNGKILNSWNPWSIECDLSTTTTQSFNEPYIFPSVDTVATENSTVNLCRAIYSTLDNTTDAPENVIIYEFDDIVKSLFRQRPNGLGYCDHAIRELGFPPCAKTLSRTITARIGKLTQSVQHVLESVPDDDAATDLPGIFFLNNMNMFLNKASFSDEHMEMLHQLHEKASVLNIIHIKDKWKAFVVKYTSITKGSKKRHPGRLKDEEFPTDSSTATRMSLFTTVCDGSIFYFFNCGN